MGDAWFFFGLPRYKKYHHTTTGPGIMLDTNGLYGPYTSPYEAEEGMKRYAKYYKHDGVCTFLVFTGDIKHFVAHENMVVAESKKGEQYD